MILEILSVALAAIGELGKVMSIKKRRAGKRELVSALKLYESILRLQVLREAQANKKTDKMAHEYGLAESLYQAYGDFADAILGMNGLALDIYSPGLSHLLSRGAHADSRLTSAMIPHLAERIRYHEPDIPAKLAEAAAAMVVVQEELRYEREEIDEETLANLLEEVRVAIAKFIRENWTYEELLSA